MTNNKLENRQHRKQKRVHGSPPLTKE